MSSQRATFALACLVAAAFLAVGCGGDSESTTESTGEAVASRPAPPKSDFPSADGRSLIEVVQDAGSAAEVVVSPAALVFHKGVNRYPFGVFESDRTPVNDVEIALYISKVPNVKGGGQGGNGESKGAKAQAHREALEAPALGPFPAAAESITTKPAFRAQTTTGDPDAASVVYTTDLDFTSDGEWRIAALIRDGDQLYGSQLPSASVGQYKRVPQVGDKAPRINTPTAADVGGDLAQITTRVPPDTQNRVDFADVVGKKPVMLLFATPQFCQSRVCGPVVDVAEQVKEEYGDEVEFIHMEIFNENDPSKDVRPQVRAFNLPSEPWLFAIDREGVIRATIEGPFGVEAMTEVVGEVRG